MCMETTTAWITTTRAGLKRITKAELRMALAQHRMAQYPALYEGHYDDALKFVGNAYGKTRADLVLAAEVHGVIKYVA